MKTGKIQGASEITHRLKVYSGGESMIAGLKKLESESRKAGLREGFEQGVKYAQSMNIIERLLGRKLK